MQCQLHTQTTRDRMRSKRAVTKAGYVIGSQAATSARKGKGQDKHRTHKSGMARQRIVHQQ